jgi:hypothetical protein
MSGRSSSDVQKKYDVCAPKVLNQVELKAILIKIIGLTDQ